MVDLHVRLSDLNEAKRQIHPNGVGKEDEIYFAKIAMSSAYKGVNQCNQMEQRKVELL